MAKEVYEININDQKVEITFTPNNENPFRKSDAGTATVKTNGVSSGDFPYQRTSFIPLPFATG